jgi:hypothetical protein
MRAEFLLPKSIVNRLRGALARFCRAVYEIMNARVRRHDLGSV